MIRCGGISSHQYARVTRLNGSADGSVVVLRQDLLITTLLVRTGLPSPRRSPAMTPVGPICQASRISCVTGGCLIFAKHFVIFSHVDHPAHYAVTERPWQQPLVNFIERFDVPFFFCCRTARNRWLLRRRRWSSSRGSGAVVVL